MSDFKVGDKIMLVSAGYLQEHLMDGNIATVVSSYTYSVEFTVQKDWKNSPRFTHWSANKSEIRHLTPLEKAML